MRIEYSERGSNLVLNRKFDVSYNCFCLNVIDSN